MEYRSIKGFTGMAQLGLLFVFLGAGFMLAAGIQYLIGYQMVPAGLPVDKFGEEVMKAMLKPENVVYARISQVLSTFCVFFIPAVLFMLICHGKNKFWLGFNKHLNGWQILIGVVLIFLANIIANPLADLSKSILTNFPNLNALGKSLEAGYTEQVTALSNLKSWGEFIIAIVIMAFFPALFEEVFFRGTLQNLLERWWKAPLLAVLASSLIFSLIHMSVFLFLSRVVLGFVLGMMYQRSKNLWVNIFAHFINNTIVLIQMFVLSRSTQKIEVDKLDPSLPLWAGLIAAGGTYGLFLLFEKLSVKNRKQIAFEEQDLLEQADISQFPRGNKNT